MNGWPRVEERHFVLRARDEGWSEPWRGHIVRSAIGACLRHLDCVRGCGDGPCRAGPGCSWVDHFEPGAEVPYRLRIAEINTPVARDETVEISLVAWRPGTLDALTRGLRLGLERGLGKRRTRFDILGESTALTDLDALSHRWSVAKHLVLVSPTELKSAEWTESADLSLIFPALRGRLRQLGVSLPPLPRAEGVFEHACVEKEYVRATRWSSAQEQRYPINGWVGAWEIQATEAQACWLALGETFGVGRGGARGQGEMFCPVEGPT